MTTNTSDFSSLLQEAQAQLDKTEEHFKSVQPSERRKLESDAADLVSEIVQPLQAVVSFMITEGEHAQAVDITAQLGATRQALKKVEAQYNELNNKGTAGGDNVTAAHEMSATLVHNFMAIARGIGQMVQTSQSNLTMAEQEKKNIEADMAAKNAANDAERLAIADKLIAQCQDTIQKSAQSAEIVSKALSRTQEILTTTKTWEDEADHALSLVQFWVDRTERLVAETEKQAQGGTPASAIRQEFLFSVLDSLPIVPMHDSTGTQFKGLLGEYHKIPKNSDLYSKISDILQEVEGRFSQTG